MPEYGLKKKNLTICAMIKSVYHQHPPRSINHLYHFGNTNDPVKVYTKTKEEFSEKVRQSNGTTTM